MRESTGDDGPIVLPDGVRDPVVDSVGGAAAGAWALYGLAVLAVVVLPSALGNSLAGFLVGAGAGVLLAVLGASQARRVRQERSAGALALLARDPRAPVVYFRAFRHDVTTARPVTSLMWQTEEDQLAVVLNRIGPAVAIGEPGEELPDIGASRFYVPDDQWQDAVRALLPRAALMVLRIGDTDSFWWEVGQAVERAAPERLLFVVPRDRVLYERFRVRFNRLAPHRLPVLDRWQRPLRSRNRGSLHSVLFFDRDWRPEAVFIPDVRVPFRYRNAPAPLVPVLTLALAPLADRLAVPWPPLTVNRRYAIFLAVTLGWLLLVGCCLAAAVLYA